MLFSAPSLPRRELELGCTEVHTDASNGSWLNTSGAERHSGLGEPLEKCSRATAEMSEAWDGDATASKKRPSAFLDVPYAEDCQRVQLLVCRRNTKDIRIQPRSSVLRLKTAVEALYFKSRRTVSKESATHKSCTASLVSVTAQCQDPHGCRGRCALPVPRPMCWMFLESRASCILSPRNIQTLGPKP